MDALGHDELFAAGAGLPVDGAVRVTVVVFAQRVELAAFSRPVDHVGAKGGTGDPRAEGDLVDLLAARRDLDALGRLADGLADVQVQWIDAAGGQRTDLVRTPQRGDQRVGDLLAGPVDAGAEPVAALAPLALRRNLRS